MPFIGVMCGRCCAITVIHCRFIWCNVVINVIFNASFGSTICRRQILFQRYFLNCNFKLFGENCVKIVTAGGQICIIKVFEITR
jgi:hypothetical protein